MITALPSNGVSSGPAPLRGRLLFVVNSDWFFVSHRLALAERARAEGFEVHIAAVDTGASAAIRAAGFPFHALRLSRKGTDPIRELGAVAHLLRLYRDLRPDIVHHVTPKPVLYGSLAARLVSGTVVVNAVTGLGYLFATRERAGILRSFVRTLYRRALSHPHAVAIFQNTDDLREFLQDGLVSADRATVIRGAGVNCSHFPQTEPPAGPPVVMLVARMLWDKGVAEFVEAARMLQSRGVPARWVLVGGPDEGNPSSIPQERLREWAESGVIEWWGHRADIPAVLGQASVVVLPSYREGLPKSLLEGAASGRPLVATDVPGCREVVVDGENGLLVPVRDPVALADAMERLVASPELRARFGAASRRLAEVEFAEDLIFEATLSVYRRLLAKRSGSRHGPAPNDPDGRRTDRHPTGMSPSATLQQT